VAGATLKLCTIRETVAGGFLSSIPFGRQRLMGNETTRQHSAAVTLQKYFRMWLAQARLVRLQLDAIGKSSSDVERIVFPEQSPTVRRSRRDLLDFAYLILIACEGQ